MTGGQKLSSRNIGSSAVPVPKSRPCRKNYDVEKKGRYSAGTFSQPKATKTPSKKRQPVKLPIEVPEDSD